MKGWKKCYSAGGGKFSEKQRILQAASKQLLANPVMEYYEISLS
jgi:phosphoribosylformylglycinamidine (FGAM) synthase PurS component